MFMVERTCKVEVIHSWLVEKMEIISGWSSSLWYHEDWEFKKNRRKREKCFFKKKNIREKTSLECRSLLWMDFSYSDLFKLLRKSIASSRL